jgi:hypothetical protein
MERAHNLFLEMKECGVATNTQCFNPLIIGFATQVNLFCPSESAEALHQSLTMVGLQDVFLFIRSLVI